VASGRDGCQNRGRVHRFHRRVDRGAALLATLWACGCESTAPAASSTERFGASAAVEWIGTRAEPSPTPTLPEHPGGLVVHIGDSFAKAYFSQRLKPRFRAEGARYFVESERSTYTTTWASDPKLDAWLGSHPSLVIVTLGANEVLMPDPSLHAGAVRQIARKIHSAGAACVWVTPPLWRRDTGFMQVIHDHCAPCLFFDSDAIVGALGPDEREDDRIHPNAQGGARWAAAFWSWLADHRDPAGAAWSLLRGEARRE
jgi:lysophospholipase L1-like esterase